jgi:hypothetical protein
MDPIIAERRRVDCSPTDRSNVKQLFGERIAEFQSYGDMGAELIDERRV